MGFAHQDGMFRPTALITAALTFALVTAGCPGGLSERLEDHIPAESPASSAPAADTVPDSAAEDAAAMEAEDAAPEAADARMMAVAHNFALEALASRGLTPLAEGELPHRRYRLSRVSWSCGAGLPDSVRVPSYYGTEPGVSTFRTLLIHEGYCQDAEGATGGWRASTAAERRMVRATPSAWAYLPPVGAGEEAHLLGAASVESGVVFLEYRPLPARPSRR